MNFRTTLILLALLAVVGSVIYFTQSTDKSKTPNEADAKKLLDVKSEKVNKLAITDSSGHHTTLVKEGDNWKMTEPVNSPALSYSASDLVSSVTDIRSKGRPESSPNAGLDNPKYKVEIFTDDGKSTVINFGNKTGIGDVMYAQVAGGEVNLVDSSLDKTLGGAADSLRDKHILAGVEQSKIRQIRLTYGNTNILLSKPSDKWIVMEPDRMLADESTVSSLLSSITGIEATEFVDNDAIETKFDGLERPALKVWYSTESATTQPITTVPTVQPGTTISIGAADSQKKEHYFLQVSGGGIVKVEKSVLDDLKKTPLDFRDRVVATIAPANVTQISITKETFEPPPPPSTQPTTLPATVPSLADAKLISTKTRILVKRKTILGPVAPTTLPATTTSSTQPATKPEAVQSVWQFEGDDKTQIEDLQVDDMLSKFDPLKADKFIEALKGPMQERYIIDIIATAPGSGPVPYHFEIISPGGAPQTVEATNNGFNFEIPIAVLNPIAVDFLKR